MNKEKGEAAFDSVNDVLTDKIINTSEKHGKNKDTSNPDSTSNRSFDIDEEKPASPRGRAILIAACAGIVLLIIGIFLFRCRKCCREE